MDGGRQVEPTQGRGGRTAGGMDGRREGGKGDIMPCYVRTGEIVAVYNPETTELVDRHYNLIVAT